jgi:DNA (cytosine-5)-methyltransferase 1
MNVRNAVSNGNAPTVISTFAGCGGSSLGYKLAGFRELLAVEWDNNAVETFRLNFPEVPVYHGDIAKLTVNECMRLSGVGVGELDVFDGSPPCQGFSTAGKRKFDDPRNSLFREYARLLRELQPRVFVMENVTGMIKGHMKQAYLTIIAELRACGYRAKGEVLNAMYYNVPQSRERVIIIGVRNDLGIEPTHPKPQTKPMTVMEALIGLNMKVQDKAIMHTWIDESPSGRNTKTWHLAYKAKQGQKYAGQQRRAIWGKPFPTITKPSSDGMGIKSYLRNSCCHPIETRCFSIRELARGCSFPDSFKFDENGACRIGNSVPPNLMLAIATHIKENILTHA